MPLDLNTLIVRPISGSIGAEIDSVDLTDISVKYVGRKASSSTATGNLNKHLAQQKEILEKILKD